MRVRDWRKLVLIFILLLVAFWLMSLIIELVDKAKFAIHEASEVQDKHEALEARRLILEENLAVLNTARGQDAAIRTAFGVARQGEEVIVVVPTVPVEGTPTLSWWERGLRWLGF